MAIADYCLKILEILVPAFVALVVGGVTAWISIRQIRQAAAVAEKQIKGSLEASMLQYRAQVLSGNRQEWINTVRDVSADYASCAGAEALRCTREPVERENDVTAGDQRALFLRSKLRLLINPNEKAGQDVLGAMNGLGSWFSLDSPKWEAFIPLKEQFETAIGALLKSEWERVKRGE